MVQITQPVLGTISSEDKATLKALVSQGVTGMTVDLPPMSNVKAEDNTSSTAVPSSTPASVHRKPMATAAGSAVQLPRVEAELQCQTAAAK